MSEIQPHEVLHYAYMFCVSWALIAQSAAIKKLKEQADD